MRNIFKKKEPFTPKHFTMGGSWGDAINFTSDDYTSVVGWKQTKPRNGDILHIPLQSGAVAKCLFENVKYCNDPADMFFADLKEQRG